VTSGEEGPSEKKQRDRMGDTAKRVDKIRRAKELKAGLRRVRKDENPGDTRKKAPGTGATPHQNETEKRLGYSNKKSLGKDIAQRNSGFFTEKARGGEKSRRQLVRERSRGPVVICQGTNALGTRQGTKS